MLGGEAEVPEQVAGGRGLAEAVDADWRRALTMGVTAVPTIIFNGRRLVGFQPFEEFRRLITG